MVLTLPDGLPDMILQQRCRLARLGERDAFHWWESEAATPAGEYVFRRLFPRSHLWAGLEMAMEAAKARHAAFMPAVPAVTLFHLGGLLDAAVEERLFRHKLAGAPPADLVPSAPVEAGGSASDALVAQGVASEEAVRRLRDGGLKPQDRSVCLGEVAAQDLQRHETLRNLVETLAAGYYFSTPRRLVVPYFRLKGA